jgi:ABC-2 type transport system permease protein
MSTMNASAMPDSPLGAQTTSPQLNSATNPFCWSLQRELWENRSIFIAPLTVAALFLLGFLISMVRLPEKIRSASASTGDPMRLQHLIQQPYEFAELLIMGTLIIVGVFYCLDALYGERRDRSILFWKSLPVSDLTTVLSKATVPILVIPLVSFAITVAIHWIMLSVSSVVVAGSGISIATLWSNLPLFKMSMELLYHLVAFHGLYYAPIYAWLLLVSAYAPRAPFLWAGLPLLAIGFVEKIAFNTSHFWTILQTRLVGGPELKAATPPGSMMPALTMQSMGDFLISPGLWMGLAVAAIFLGAAVHLRRSQGPI